MKHSIPLNFRQSHHLSSGFSLIEVMITMFIFSVTSLGIIQGLTFTAQSARLNSAESVANASINGYISQIKSLQYYELIKLSQQGAGTPVTMINLVARFSTSSDDSNASAIRQLTSEFPLDEWVEEELVYGDIGDNFAYLTLKNRISISKPSEKDYLLVTYEFQWEPGNTQLPVQNKSGVRNFYITDRNFAPADLI